MEDTLIFRCLQVVSGASPLRVRDRNADLTLLYPYAFPFSSASAGAITRSLLHRSRARGGQWVAEALLRRFLEVPQSSRILAVSHENLDRSPWNLFGDALRKTTIPRLTSWPRELDPVGFRLPYWWNYVNWPEVPGPGPGNRSRFGRAYDLDVLCGPQKIEAKKRRDRAVWLTSHLDFPRSQILHLLEQRVPVDVVRGIPWGSKEALLRGYRYCVVSENSPGYGYETEKLPEARVAGCIPVGYEPNPFSDFNEGAYFFVPPRDLPESLPALLTTKPSLLPLLKYLSAVVDQRP